MSKSEVQVNPKIVRAVERMKEPSSLKYFRAFLGFGDYFEKNSPGFSKAAEFFYRLKN